MTHADLLTSLAATVRTSGASAALEALRADRPAMLGPDGSSIAYHDTLGVFAVWAVDRLVAAGVTDLGLLWHPLTDPRSALAWWDEATLRSAEAVAGFVPSTRALPGEPAPFEPLVLAAA
jgi:hypothetical protein